MLVRLTFDQGTNSWLTCMLVTDCECRVDLSWLHYRCKSELYRLRSGCVKWPESTHMNCISYKRPSFLIWACYKRPRFFGGSPKGWTINHCGGCRAEILILPFYPCQQGTCFFPQPVGNSLFVLFPSITCFFKGTELPFFSFLVLCLLFFSLSHPSVLFFPVAAASFFSLDFAWSSPPHND